MNNSLTLNKRNLDRDGVWITDLISIDFLRFYFSVFSLVLVLIEKIYQTLETVFDHISNHLEVCQKYTTTHHIFQHSPQCLEMWSSSVPHVSYITSKMLFKGYLRCQSLEDV